MKDDEPFREFAVKLESVKLDGGGSSLVVAGEVDLATAITGHQDRIVDLVKSQSCGNGVTHADLKKAFIASGAGKESTFDRAWRGLKDSGRLKREKTGGKTLYFTAEVGEPVKVSQRNLEELGQIFAEHRAQATK